MATLKSIRKVTVLLCLFCALAIHGIVVGAQQATPGELGVSQTVNVTDKDAVFQFTYELEPGDTIYASAYDPSRQMGLEINLIEPNGVTLTQAYPNAIGTVLPPFTVASGGTYTIEIFRPEWAQQTGTFDLIVDRVAFTAVKLDGIYTGQIPQAGEPRFSRIQASVTNCSASRRPENRWRFICCAMMAAVLSILTYRTNCSERSIFCRKMVHSWPSCRRLTRTAAITHCN